MNSLTKVLLVLLRLAIGWHFFFEGLEKIDSVYRGPTETSKPWSSASYLREATGPFSDFFHRQVGDPDEAALAHLTVRPLAPDQDPARTLPYTRLPPALASDWDAYLQQFVKHYQPDERAADLAAKRLQQSKDRAAHWLLQGAKRVKKTFPSGTVEVEASTPQRVAAYRQLVEHVRAMEKEDLPAFGRDVWKDKLRSAKADIARGRAELLQDLSEQTEEMRRSLADVLTPQQKQRGPVPASAERPVELIDQVTMWGLTIVGACLLLGLFTRTACVAGAAFLLLVYLAIPPFPWVPENLRTEGHYLFVNKNLIELLALLVLATLCSGRWAGLDGLVQFLNPRRRPALADADSSAISPA